MATFDHLNIFDEFFAIFLNLKDERNKKIGKEEITGKKSTCNLFSNKHIGKHSKKEKENWAVLVKNLTKLHRELQRVEGFVGAFEIIVLPPRTC